MYSPSSLCVSIFNYYPLRKFQLFNTVLSIIVTMLYIRTSDLIHLIPQSVYFHHVHLLEVCTAPFYHTSLAWLYVVLLLLFLGLVLCCLSFLAPILSFLFMISVSFPCGDRFMPARSGLMGPEGRTT